MFDKHKCPQKHKIIKQMFSQTLQNASDRRTWMIKILLVRYKMSHLRKNVRILHTNANFHVRKTSTKRKCTHRKFLEVRVNFTWNTCAPVYFHFQFGNTHDVIANIDRWLVLTWNVKLMFTLGNLETRSDPFTLWPWH